MVRRVRRGDNGGDATGVEKGPEMVSNVGLVGDHRWYRAVADEGLCVGHVMTLARGENEAYRLAQAIDNDVDLARQSTTRTADGLILSPPFAPGAC